jgi:hypothetical protein
MLLQLGSLPENGTIAVVFYPSFSLRQHDRSRQLPAESERALEHKNIKAGTTYVKRCVAKFVDHDDY